MSKSWVEEISELNAIADDVSFVENKESFFTFTEQDRNDKFTPYISCQFKITKTDNLDLVALRVPQQLRERIREEAGSVDAEGSIFLALMEYGLNELVKNNKRILVSKNQK